MALRVELRPPAPRGAELARVAQLTLRTNQMNASLLRFASEAELAAWLADASESPTGAAPHPRPPTGAAAAAPGRHRQLACPARLLR